MNDRLRKILSDVFEVKENEITELLTKDDFDSWDSLRQMDLVVSLEEEFDFQLEIEDIVRLDSVKEIINVLNSKNVL
tara:strand:- start:149 stop:379 length:231 start_codon:yes stop_codon:yes gene_type:complete